MLERYQNRTFKSKANLREHLRVHTERGDIDFRLDPSTQQSQSLSGNTLPSALLLDDDEEEMIQTPRKRKRPEVPEEMRKRLKRTDSQVGKDWVCEEGDCVKAFKTVSLALLGWVR